MRIASWFDARRGGALSPRVVVGAVGLVALSVVGAVLVTSGDDSPSLEETVTVDGVTVRIPQDWATTPDSPFQYRPPDVGPATVESWTIGWACPPDDCVPRSLEEWTQAAPDLATFAAARDERDAVFEDFSEGFVDGAGADRAVFVQRGTLINDYVVINVAVLDDGASRYLECDAVIEEGNEDLAEEIIPACLDAVLPSG